MRRHLLVRVGSTKGPAHPFPVVDRVRFVSVGSAWAKRSFTTHVPIPDRSIPFPHRHARRVSNFIQTADCLENGKARSYRDTKSGAMDAATFLKSRQPHSEVAVKRPAKRSADRSDRSRVMTRLEQRGGVAIAFMTAALWIMLLIAAREHLF